MPLCYLIGAGDCTEQVHPRPGDLLIAVDGGEMHLRWMGLKEDLFVGDGDSCPQPYQAGMAILHPTRKDDTDMLLAYRAGRERGYRHFCVLGGTGGARIDHTVANLQMLLCAARAGDEMTLVCAGQMAQVLHQGRLEFSEKRSGYLSVFAMGGAAMGVTLRHVSYSLEGATLEEAYPLGVSNAFLPGEKACVAVERGSLLLIWEQTWAEYEEERV